MNLIHRCLCRSSSWRKVLDRFVVPWAFADVQLGQDVLELGPGHGLTTELLRSRIPRITALEIDPELTAHLATRLRGTNVTVVQGDASAIPLDDGRFSGAVSFHMLHHVHSADLQDKLFQEVHRVLRPGGTFVGIDSLGLKSLWMRLIHMGDTLTPIEPGTLRDRLSAVGFEEITVDTNSYAFRFRARRPPTSGSA
ncbi:MAG: class I SAM-dependent methyltransferase [Acidobacteriia bacterium]|nr:class I SAM-dependent methyltransferase [Terriglobia bacterium]